MGSRRCQKILREPKIVVEKMKSLIVFGNEKIKNELEKLKNSKTEDKNTYEWIIRALEDLKQNAFSGTQIPKRLIPKEYNLKFGKLDNLWKYNLPNAWRLIYTIKREQVIILSVILEWMNHKDYERKFKY
jgi:Txe/YoeB family toxin of Txe-Axe toxin-antitoxin module